MLTLDGMTPAEQTLAFQIEDELLDAQAMDPQSVKGYAAVCIERARAFAAHFATMEIHPYLLVWSAEMEKKHKRTTVKCHHNHLPWLSALMVVRYGEAVEHWPAAVSEKDIEKARAWRRGAQPSTVSL
jgi:hypothetical protein